MEHELAQELAKITLAIQDARREFQGVVDEKDAFLLQREQEALQLVTQALETAREAVLETNSYALVVGKLRQEVERVVDELKAAHITMQRERRDFAQQTKEAREIIDKKVVELETFTASVQQEKSRINGLLNSVKMERQQLQREQKKIDDDRAKLTVALQVWQTRPATTTE